MNRLILIGNGFDLAHGMKTSYADFINNYISNGFFEAHNSREYEYEDDLMHIQQNSSIIRRTNLEKYSELNHYIKFLTNEPLNNLHPAYQPRSIRESKSQNDFFWNIKNAFTKRLITQCHHCGWVDIENEYYKELKRIMSLPFTEMEKAIKILNSTFDILKSSLENYLSQLPLIPSNEKFNNHLLYGIIKKDHIVTRQLRKDEPPRQTLVLCFNYTNTIIPYFKDRPNTSIIYIHGIVNDPNNPIIFGFGDELDAHYPSLEAIETNGFRQNIKTFWYSKTTNYHNLIRFIDSDDFQVDIFGHSCGLSDRTMLNMIFEHKKCMAIKLFYHQKPDGSNNYTALTEDISRHFKDKGMMRKKIIPFTRSSPMPQID